MTIKTLSQIISVLDPSQRRSAYVLLGLMLAGMVLETVGIGAVIPAMWLMTSPESLTTASWAQPLLEALGHPSQNRIVMFGLAALVAFYAFKALFLAFLALRQSRFLARVQADISQRLFAGYLRQPWTFHLQRNSAELIRNVKDEVDQFVINALAPLLLLTAEALVLFGIATLLFVVEPLGAVLVVSILGLAAWGFYGLTRARVLRWGEARQHHEALRYQHLQQGLAGAKDVKLLGRESDFVARFNEHNTWSARVVLRQSTLQQLPRLWFELLAVTGLSGLILVMLAQGKALNSIVPAIAVFAAAAFRLMPSVNRALTSVQQLRYGQPAIETIFRELQMLADAPDAAGGGRLPFRHEIELQNVTFRYPGAAAPALQDITLRIRHGSSVGFIGASGAGKSTLVDLILGLLTPESGRVLVDGADIQSNLRGWQNQIGYVPQAIYLTDDSLRRNIAFGVPDSEIDDTAVWRALTSAQLDAFVRTLPEGLETPAGEAGVRLSGGQRQRIGIARALYHDPPVLVLDEATSALDTETERGVMDAVTALQGNKTLLIVTHRMSTVEQCEKLFRFQEGSAKNDSILCEIVLGV